MAKYLKFRKCKAGHYVVLGKNGVPLGTIASRGDIFTRTPVYGDIDGTEYTAGCLRELADAIEALFPKCTPQRNSKRSKVIA